MTAKKKEYIISISDDHLHRVREVAKELKAKGFTGAEVLEAAGAITGSSAPDKVEALRKIAGVSAIEESQSVQIPPPGSKVQ